MEDWQERVVQESKDLDEKIIKHEAMICHDDFDMMSKLDQRLLVQQLAAMKQYASVLKARIQRF